MISIVCTDITTLQVDAIVNAANTGLRGGGGVDGAIHRAAGPQLQEYCQRLNGCRTGDAKISPGFDLPARWVIHAVGPIWQGGGGNESALLAACYLNAFEQALAKRVKSIALPCISTGAYGYPKPEAATIALTAMRDFESHFDKIVACCFSEEDAGLYRQTLARLRGETAG
ncbi:MAG: Appr-1-p processing protein [Gammaproteobacteria bacterium]|nr:MAG: Appr-1-p processing protein [Gammaproteobacteria bacterium]TND02702.1 MAG: Appr-1-p processing protein [Gammaproteobacteria bacterium]